MLLEPRDVANLVTLARSVGLAALATVGLGAGVGAWWVFHLSA